jgi:EAL domain-containing protein (putative c-di-GMP-specific phosphodiesterase class I)
MAKFDYDIAFQPIVSLDATKGYRIEGHEVLSRFRNEDTQSKILSLEHSGLIADFDLDLIEKVLMSPELTQGRLSVNISNASLCKKEFLPALESLLKLSRNSNIDFEVTETFKPEIPEIQKLIRICHDKGLKVGLDDYGAGHSNFDLVQAANFDFIKIDGSLVKTYDSSFVSRAKVLQLTDYCKANNIAVTAEFISSIDQLNKFDAIGINKGQGVLFGLAAPQPYTNSKVRANILHHDLPSVARESNKGFEM